MSSTLIGLLLALSLRVLATPANLTFTDCFDTNGNVSQKISVSNVYAQVLHSDELNSYLDLVLIADSPDEIIGRADSSLNLATLFTSTSILTLSAWSNSSYLCDQIRPTDSALTSNNNTDDDAYCPIAAGPFALSAQIPWGSNRALTTLTTRLRAVDTYSHELLCIDMLTTPLDPRNDGDTPYGAANIIFWGTVALAIAYWIVVGVARIVSAWNRGISRPGKTLWERVQSAGFILASAASGERFASSPALLRFCTPSMRDVIFHTQWCSALAMIAVQWPPFIYPLLTQTSWATLSYNISIAAGSDDHHWNPLFAPDFTAPSDFSSQINDQSSVLFLDPSVPNTLFTLPSNASTGMTDFAYSIGVRPQDLFGICLTLFLGIVAAAIALSTVMWLFDRFASFLAGLVGQSHQGPGMTRLGGTRSPAFGSKDMLDSTATAGAAAEESRSLNGKDALMRPPSKFTLSGSTERGITATARKPWWRIRSSMSSFHGSVLQGNLVRVLILFHLPVTIFSAYQMTLSKDIASMSSIVLAGFSFAIFSILIPVFLVVRVRLTTTSKLYDETRTLLGLGPLYNHYRHGSQMFAGLFFATNVAFGVTIGAGQKSGTAQAIVILVVEVISALVTSVWLPWGIGASMGLISFLFCVARIVIAVLLLILTPAIDIGSGAGGWVAYGILIILALVYLALLIMLVVKLLEAIVRIFGFAGFDQSKHVVDTGLLGACGLAGCCGGSRKRRRPRKDAKKTNKDVNARYKSTQNDNRDRDSIASSLGSPTRPGTGKGSTNSGPPPSVLKPEHALRPYREDSDDEGYIMGAWQPFQTSLGKGYVPVEPTPTSPKPSGFSRVGGGRAHIDTPYAIKAGSTQTFPSIGQLASQSQHNASAGSLKRIELEEEEEDTPSLSAMNVVRNQEPSQGSSRSDGLPPGAMPPFHVRTKSQTAIIEHAIAGPSAYGVVGPNGRPTRQGATPPPSSYGNLAGGGEDDGGSDTDVPRRKPWYHLRRHRAHSSEGSAGILGGSGSSEPLAAAAAPADPAPAPPGRSFVVVRKPQVSPGGSGGGRAQKLSTASAPGLEASSLSQGPSRQSYPSASSGYPPTNV